MFRGWSTAGPLGASILIACLACNALSGVEDLTEVKCVTDCGERPSDGTSSASSASSSSSSSSSSSASSSSSGGELARDAGPTLPSYCTGVIFYAPFDGSPNARGGQAPTEADNDFEFVAAKYGTGVRFTPDSSFQYASPSGGKVIHKPDVGSVMMWVKPNSTSGNTRPFFRPQKQADPQGNNDGNLTGPALVLGDGSELGMRFSNAAKAVANPGNVTGWSTGSFHLVVGTWNQAQHITFNVVNTGGTTRVDQPTTYTPNAATTNNIRISDNLFNSDAIIDEVAVWDHELTVAEIAALFQATASLGNTCP